MGKVEKKKDKKDNVTAIDPLVEPHEEGEMSLTPFELSQLDLHQTRAQLQQNIVEKFKLNVELLDIEYKNNRAVIQNKIREAKSSMDAAQRDHNRQLGEIEKRLGIKMAEYAVTETGVLKHQDDCR